MSYVSSSQEEDQSGIFVLMEKEFNFHGATQGRGMDGWQSAKRAAEFWTRACLGGPPLFGLPSAFIRGFVSRQRYVLHQSTEDYLLP